APSKNGGGEKPGHPEAAGGHGKDRGGEAQDTAKFEWDTTLQHPRCVFQVLKRHFSRYTPEMVERYCGVPKEVFVKVAETFSSASGPDKTGAICYAVGWTQHSKGVQIIRSAAILQLLLGNIGRPGGGILALRGHASIQGSTDVPTLYDILPGYLPMPFFEADSHKLKNYIKKHKTRTGLWSGFDKYFVRLVKAYYGAAATTENDYAFNWLPRISGDQPHLVCWCDMAAAKVTEWTRAREVCAGVVGQFTTGTGNARQLEPASCHLEEVGSPTCRPKVVRKGCPKPLGRKVIAPPQAPAEPLLKLACWSRAACV